MLWLFGSAGASNTNNKKYQFWRQDNNPIELSSNRMQQERLDYIHNNPVEERIVDVPEHYIYSSAVNYAGGTGLVEVDFIG